MARTACSISFIWRLFSARMRLTALSPEGIESCPSMGKTRSDGCGSATSRANRTLKRDGRRWLTVTRGTPVDRTSGGRILSPNHVEPLGNRALPFSATNKVVHGFGQSSKLAEAWRLPSSAGSCPGRAGSVNSRRWRDTARSPARARERVAAPPASEHTTPRRRTSEMGDTLLFVGAVSRKKTARTRVCVAQRQQAYISFSTRCLRHRIPNLPRLPGRAAP